MKVGLNSALNCQPMRFRAEELHAKKSNDLTTFKSTNKQKLEIMPVEEKYELAKGIIAAQESIIAAQKSLITSLNNQKQKNLPESNLLNKFA